MSAYVVLAKHEDCDLPDVVFVGTWEDAQQYIITWKNDKVDLSVQATVSLREVLDSFKEE